MKQSRWLLLVLVGSLGGMAMTVAACAGDGGAATPEETSDASTKTPKSDASDDDATPRTSPPTAEEACAVARAYYLECGGDLECGPEHFDAWCEAQDLIINSDAFRSAQIACLTSANCGGDERRACMYATYVDATPTEAQAKLVQSFCETCEADDVSGCRSRQVAYAPARGPSNVSDVFVAAWELSDSLVDKIRAECTGSSLTYGGSLPDGGSGPTCLRAFSECAAGLYIDAFPACPD